MPFVLVADGILTQEQYEESIRRLDRRLEEPDGVG